MPSWTEVNETLLSGSAVQASTSRPLPITQTVSANHNTTINILRKTPKERLPWFSHKLKPQSMAWMTQKSGAKLMQVRVPSAARLFSPQVSFQCRLSYSVCLYSPRMQLHASTSVCMLKLPNTGSHITLFGHAKILHTLVGMGSAALVAAVVSPRYESTHKGVN